MKFVLYVCFNARYYLSLSWISVDTALLKPRNAEESILKTGSAAFVTCDGHRDGTKPVTFSAFTKTQIHSAVDIVMQ